MYKIIFIIIIIITCSDISVGVKAKRVLNGDWHVEVRPVLDLWKALNCKSANLTEPPPRPTTSQRSVAANNGGDGPALRPVDAFVGQELNFATRLVRNVHKSLAAVNQTIRTNARPSPTVSDTVFSLLRLQVGPVHGRVCEELFRKYYNKITIT